MIHGSSVSPLSSMPMPSPSVPVPQGGRLVAVRGQLPLRSTALAVDAVGGAARVKLEQVFDNPHAEPLRVRYELPLPADAAVSGFAFRIGDRRIVGTVDEVKKARETFERAIAEGRTAALIEETRTSLFSQELGNIPPGATIVAEILIDQPLAWIDVEGSWEWRFPLTAAPRYLGAVDASAGAPGDLAGRTPDARRVMLDVTQDETGVRASLALSIRDALVAGRSPESPSHPLQIQGSMDGSSGALRVALGGGGTAALDRDLVVRWPVALATASLTIAAARSGGVDLGGEDICAVLTVVPPLPSAGRDARRVPRDLAILLDTSGSMDGEPLAQAKRIASALISSLGDEDGLDLVEFSSSVRRFRTGSVRADATVRQEALAWIKSLRASGGTEMLQGITEALASMRPEAQRQVVVVTDGLIGFERDVVSAIQKSLPRGSRVHSVGVGSSTNRTLLAGVARVGGGVEVIVGLGEDPERAAARVLSRTAEPVVVDVAVEGTAILERAPARLPDLFAGAPMRIALRVRPEGGEVIVWGRAGDGAWQARATIPPRAEIAGDDAPAKLFARERAADLEAELSAGRDKDAVDRDLVAIGLRYAIATRCTSWVAATVEATVDPTDPTRRETIPQTLPFGASAEGMGLRAIAPPVHVHALAMSAAPYVMHPAPASMGAPPPPPPPMASAGGKSASEERQGKRPARAADVDAEDRLAEAEAPRDVLLEVPSLVESKEKEDGFLGGIARRVKDFFAEGARSEAPPEPAPTVAKPEDGAFAAPSSGPAVQIVRGRIVVSNADEIVIEIDVVGAPFDLRDLEAAVVLATATGAHLTAKLRADKSTRPGVHPVGTTVRLVVTLDRGDTTLAMVLAFFTSSRPGTPPIRVEIAAP